VNAGCLSIEADVCLLDDGTVVLSHDGADSLDFKNVFVKRVLGLVDGFSVGAKGYSSDLKQGFHGIYTTNTSLSVQLAIDIKTDGVKTVEAIMAAFEPLRQRNLLSFYDENLREVPDEEVVSSIDFPENLYRVPNPWLMDDKNLRRIGVVRSVFTVVITGNIPHEYIKGLPKRDFFLDGYVKKSDYSSISESPSFCPMASGTWPDMKHWDELNFSAILNKFHTKGISTRLYEIPGWPIWKRNELWIDLYKKGVSWTNADDVEAAANL
jgi:hypothetical protein